LKRSRLLGFLRGRAVAVLQYPEVQSILGP